MRPRRRACSPRSAAAAGKIAPRACAGRLRFGLLTASERGIAFAMKTRAAIAHAAGKPLEIVTVDLDGPKSGEVLVELKATGFATPTSSRAPAEIRKACFPRFSGMR